MNRPQTSEYPVWAETYISLVEDNVLEILEQQVLDYPDFINSVLEQADYSYAPGKWTIKEVAGHVIDTERVLVYRLMCFARNEAAALPSFDEDSYVLNAHFKIRDLTSFSEEFSLMRKSNLYLFKSLIEEELNRGGTASGRAINVRSLLYVIAGHVIHHTKIIKERYL
jgi:hypothetical protein